MSGEIGEVRVRNSEGRLVFYGRVRDREGAGVPGALVMVFSAAGEGEKPLGHGYCDGDGWYAVELPRPGENGPGKYLIRATAGPGPAETFSGFSWRGRAGRPGRRELSVECRVINHSLLNFTARDAAREVSLETIPETLNVHCGESDLFNARMISMSGRGYIRSGGEKGEGSFSLTVCRFKDVPGGELLRFKIIPDFPAPAGLGFDTGGLYAGLE